jgi:hypothetical protein
MKVGTMPDTRTVKHVGCLYNIRFVLAALYIPIVNLKLPSFSVTVKATGAAMNVAPQVPVNHQQPYGEATLHALPLLTCLLNVLLLRYALGKAVLLHPLLYLLVASLIIRIRCIIDAAVDVVFP